MGDYSLSFILSFHYISDISWTILGVGDLLVPFIVHIGRWLRNSTNSLFYVFVRCFGPDHAQTTPYI